MNWWSIIKAPKITRTRLPDNKPMSKEEFEKRYNAVVGTTDPKTLVFNWDGMVTVPFSGGNVKASQFSPYQQGYTNRQELWDKYLSETNTHEDGGFSPFTYEDIPNLVTKMIFKTLNIDPNLRDVARKSLNRRYDNVLRFIYLDGAEITKIEISYGNIERNIQKIFDFELRITIDTKEYGGISIPLARENESNPYNSVMAQAIYNLLRTSEYSVDYLTKVEPYFIVKPTGGGLGRWPETKLYFDTNVVDVNAAYHKVEPDSVVVGRKGEFAERLINPEHDSYKRWQNTTNRKRLEKLIKEMQGGNVFSKLIFTHLATRSGIEAGHIIRDVLYKKRGLLNTMPLENIYNNAAPTSLKFEVIHQVVPQVTEKWRKDNAMAKNPKN